MKYIADYSEFRKKSTRSLVDHCSPMPIEEKEVVLEYLKSAPVDAVRCSSIKDKILNDTTFLDCSSHTDGEYVWDDEIIYHFEKYDIELEPEFIKKVLAS